MWSAAWMRVKGRNVSQKGCGTHANEHSVFLKPCAESLLIYHVQVINSGITKNVSAVGNIPFNFFCFTSGTKGRTSSISSMTASIYLIDFSPCSVIPNSLSLASYTFGQQWNKKETFLWEVCTSQLYSYNLLFRLLWYPAPKQHHMVKHIPGKMQLGTSHSFAPQRWFKHSSKVWQGWVDSLGKCKSASGNEV